jgi:hypothetical protein
MTERASYAPPGPDAEAAIEVEIPAPEGAVYFRIPFSSLSRVFHTPTDSRADMFRTFGNLKLGIWPKLSKKIPSMNVGEVYTVTADDLGWGGIRRT